MTASELFLGDPGKQVNTLIGSLIGSELRIKSIMKAKGGPSWY